MSAPTIRTFTLGELEGNAESLRTLRDPHGFLTRMTPARTAMLADNPAAAADDLALILTLDGDDVAGVLELCAGGVAHGGATHRTHWMCNFHLAPAYRSTGAGGLMLMKAVGFSKCLLACGAPSSDTERLYRALKFVQLGPLRRHVYFCDPRVITERYLGPGAASRLVGALGRPVLRAYYGVRDRGRIRLTFEPIVHFDDRYDRLVAGRAQSGFPRDARTMNWVVRHTPDAFPYLVMRARDPVGYCLLRLTDRPPEASHAIPALRGVAMLDYYVPDAEPGIAADLVRFGVRFSRERRADVFEFQTQEPSVAEHCRRLGMVELGGRKVYYRPPPGETVDPGDWLVTHGTADVILDGY